MRPNRATGGVIVAPTSGNTGPSEPLPIVLHRGFDTLALAVQAHIPQDFFTYLEGEKERAEQERREVLIHYECMDMLLRPHGGNGYRFNLSGGPDGATWFFKKPHSNDAWGIRLSFGSYFLALHGLGAAKAHTELVLDRLGIRYTADDISISRVDFCVDLLAPGFILVPDNFVMHSAAGRRDYVTGEDKSVNGKSGRVTSVTVGSSRNRQVIIYDKRAEVIAKGKSHWWAIWNHALSKLDGNDQMCRGENCRKGTKRHGHLWPKVLQSHEKHDIFRVEIRAGKDLLKDRWDIRTWADLFAKYGDLCRETCAVVRYVEPSPTDPNRARWPNHPIWDIASAEINDDLLEMRSDADPNPMKVVHKEQHIGVLAKNALGVLISEAALRGVTFPDLPGFFATKAQEMSDTIKSHPAKAERQMREAKERYVFVRRPPDKA